MTLAEAITMVLDRTGLSTTDTDFKNRARQYIVMTAVELVPLVLWWFLDRTTTFKTTETFTISAASGTFTVGETITGTTSSSTAIVDSHDTTNSLLYVYTISADFTATETITGGTSLETATYASTTETRVYRPVSAFVTSWWSAVDETNDFPLAIIGPDEYDLLDLERDETGKVEAVYVGGVDADTGYPTLETWRTPATTAEVIRVRYRIGITEWSSSDDGSEFLTLGFPQILENGLVHGGSAKYLAEKENDSYRREEGELQRIIGLAKKHNLQMQGNRRYPPRDTRDDSRVIGRYGTDTVSAP